MKTFKTFTILALVATFTFGSATTAWAHHRHHRHHHHRHHGDVWGAAIGGTMLGIVLGSVANQPKQAAQPTVVVVSPQTGDSTAQHHEFLALELERERTRNLALKREIMLIRATSE